MTPTKVRSAAYRARKKVRDSDALVRLERYERALRDIACFNDSYANGYLKSNGSFGGFDEPVSVEAARKALGVEP